MIVHVNPIQEWFQPEGDQFLHPPLETIQTLLNHITCPLIVKEVGQGIGPESLEALLNLPLGAIEFAAYGGTNFAKLEILRQKRSEGVFGALILRISGKMEMVETVEWIVQKNPGFFCKQLIISGGIHSFLDGYYLMKKSMLPAIYRAALPCS